MGPINNSSLAHQIALPSSMLRDLLRLLVNAINTTQLMNRECNWIRRDEILGKQRLLRFNSHVTSKLPRSGSAPSPQPTPNACRLHYRERNCRSNGLLQKILVFQDIVFGPERLQNNTVSQASVAAHPDVPLFASQGGASLAAPTLFLLQGNGSHRDSNHGRAA